MTIFFYSTRGPFGAFSNFSGHPFTLDSLRWPTSEHFFQANKFVGTAHFERVRQARSPLIAARLGRSRKAPLRGDWERVKLDVMRRALSAKFRQHPALARLLCSTGEETLVEQTTVDRFWGCGSDGKGLNHLGVLLMELRRQLRQER